MLKPNILVLKTLSHKKKQSQTMRTVPNQKKYYINRSKIYLRFKNACKTNSLFELFTI